MALHWPTFFTRLGSAIVFSAIMMTGLLWNEYAFVLLALLIQILCLRDFFRMMPKIFDGKEFPLWLKITVQIIGLTLTGAPLFSLLNINFDLFPVICSLPVLIILIAVLSKKTALNEVMQALGSMFYIVLPMGLFVMLRNQSIVIPLALVLMIWMNDTMAYIVGSFIGKTPFSKISPKKTWEGTIGGALLTIIGAAIWGYYSPYYRMVDWMALSLCASIAGTAGDLLESKLKRLADVKDSGTMMPGHGGALDRFDSLLVAVPFAFLYCSLFMPALPLVIF